MPEKDVLDAFSSRVDRRSKAVTLTSTGRTVRDALVDRVIGQSPLANLSKTKRQRLLPLATKALLRGASPPTPHCITAESTG